MKQSKESGFSLIELIVATGIAGVLAATAFTNYKRFRLSAYDASADAHVRNAFVAAEAQALASETDANFFLVSTGANTLPAPLEHVTVSDNINLIAAKFDFSFSFGNNTVSYQYRYALGSHDYGCYQYLRLRYQLVVNGQESRINLDNRTPLPNQPEECI